MHKKLVCFLVALAAISTGRADAALCAKCRDLMFVDSVGKCSVCGADTASGALKLCPKCSAERRQCEHCSAKLTDAELVSNGSKPTGGDASEDTNPANRPEKRESTDRGPEMPAPAGSASENPSEQNTLKWQPGGTSPAADGPPEPPSTPVTPSNPAAESKPANQSTRMVPVTPPPASSQTAPPDQPLELPRDAATPIEALPKARPHETTAPASALPGRQPSGGMPERIDPTKSRDYTYGKWSYEIRVTDAKTRTEGRWGWLLYDGQKLPKGEVNDYYRTPWGPIYWVDVPKAQPGLHGWMPMPLPQSSRQGQRLNVPQSMIARQSPANPSSSANQANDNKAPTQGSGQTARPQTLELTKVHNGQLAKVSVGNYIVVRLAGNPAAGYQWMAVPPNTSAFRLAAKPQYVAGPQGSGGMFVFAFQAVQPGTGIIRLAYVSSADRTKPAADKFAVNVNVRAPATVATAAKPAASSSTPADGSPFGFGIW